jgi:hypothetical protein
MAKQYTYAEGVDGMTFYTKSTATVSVGYSADATGAKHGLTTCMSGSAEFSLAGVKISVSTPILLSISLTGTVKFDLKKMECESNGFWAETKAGSVDSKVSETEAKLLELQDRMAVLSSTAIDMGIKAVDLEKNAVSVS